MFHEGNQITDMGFSHVGSLRCRGQTSVAPSRGNGGSVIYSTFNKGTLSALTDLHPTIPVSRIHWGGGGGSKIFSDLGFEF